MEDFVFDFLLLPLEIQEIIVNEIVHNHVPDDWLHFAQTSQFSNWLVKRANPKKIIQSFTVELKKRKLVVSIASEKWRRYVPLMTGLNMVQGCQIQVVSIDAGAFFSKENSIWNSEFEEAFSKVSRFATRLCVCLPGNAERFVKYYQNLKHLNCIVVFGNISNILLLPWLPSNVDIHFSDDNNLEGALQKISKINHSPFVLFCTYYRSSVEEIKEFLQITTFQDGARIVPSIKKEDYEALITMLELFVKEKPIQVSHKEGVLLTENINISPNPHLHDINRNLFGVKFGCLLFS